MGEHLLGKPNVRGFGLPIGKNWRRFGPEAFRVGFGDFAAFGGNGGQSGVAGALLGFDFALKEAEVRMGCGNFGGNSSKAQILSA